MAEKGDDSNVLNPISTSSSVLSSKHLQQIPPETNESSSKGKQSSLTERGIQIEVRSTESKEQQENSVQTELTENLEAFYKLLENISKSLEEMETVFKSASSSSNATTESLAVIKRFFNTSIEAALLDVYFLSQFKNAAESLVDKTGVLGQDKNERLKNFNIEIDSKVNNLRIAADKEQTRTELKRARTGHVGTLQTYRSSFQPCRDEMQKMVTKHEALKKGLRDYEKQMIEQMPPCKNKYSQQQSSIESEISAFQKNEQSLQQISQEIDKLRKDPSIDWSGLIAAFYN